MKAVDRNGQRHFSWWGASRPTNNYSIMVWLFISALTVVISCIPCVACLCIGKARENEEVTEYDDSFNEAGETVVPKITVEECSLSLSSVPLDRIADDQYTSWAETIELELFAPSHTPATRADALALELEQNINACCSLWPYNPRASRVVFVGHGEIVLRVAEYIRRRNLWPKAHFSIVSR